MREKAATAGKPLWDVLGESSLEPVARFREMIARYRRLSEQDPLVEVARNLIHEIGYKREIARIAIPSTIIPMGAARVNPCRARMVSAANR